MSIRAVKFVVLLLLASACASDKVEPRDGDTNPGTADDDADDDGSDGTTDTDGDTNPKMDAGSPSKVDAGKATKADTGSPTKADSGSTTAGDSGDSMQADGNASEPAPKSTGPGDWAAGDYPPDIKAQTYLEIADLPGSKGNVRKYKVHVPKSYDANKPAPVVFCFHGLGQDAVSFCVGATGLPEKSDAEGFVLVMPNGVGNSWDAGTCCSSNGLDEMEFIRAVFDEVGKHVNVDLGRVYATGLSNGGYLSYRVGCEMSDIFVAVAPGAGAIGIPSIGGGTGASSTFAKCEPKQRVSVLDLHGTADPLIAYRLVKPSLDLMAQSDGCSLETEPAKLPMSGGDTTCESYKGCPAGVEVTGCKVDGGGHCWFGDPTGTCGTGAQGTSGIVGNDSNFLKNTDVAWDFFKRVSR
jgi:polyhydroxybutyrate depolymerase